MPVVGDTVVFELRCDEHAYRFEVTSIDLLQRRVWLRALDGSSPGAVCSARIDKVSVQNRTCVE